MMNVYQMNEILNIDSKIAIIQSYIDIHIDTILSVTTIGIIFKLLRLHIIRSVAYTR